MNSIKKMMLSGALGCLISGMAYADGSSPQPVKPYWQDIQVVAVNKEKPRSSFMSYADRETALTSRFEKSPYYSLLNGTWKFFFVDSYKDLPQNITDPSVNTSSWDDITVPGNWEVQGHGIAIYTNHGYEFKPKNPQPLYYRKRIRLAYTAGTSRYPQIGITGIFIYTSAELNPAFTYI